MHLVVHISGIVIGTQLLWFLPDVEFTRTEALSWFDPINWCLSGDAAGQCVASQGDLLETERIPCRYDTVTFPEHRNFLVDLGTGVDIFMRSLFMGGQVGS